MPIDLIILILIVLGMAVLFVTERLSADLVSITGLMLLILLGYLQPQEAFSGFSSSVVLTLIPMFMLGAGLRLTGVTDLIANFVTSYFGKSEVASLIIVMVLGVFFSSFMNNVAAAALLLPTVISIAHKTSNSPSRLLIPLTFAILLGGTTTLIGTAPNILASDILFATNKVSLGFFDFTLYGLCLSFLGIVYMVFIGRHLLPNNKKLLNTGSVNLSALYHLKEHIFALRVPKGAQIDGENLASLHFGESLGVNVVSIVHAGNRLFNPGPESKIYAGDTLIVNGLKSDLTELSRFRKLKIEGFNYKQYSGNLKIKALKLKEQDRGKTLRELDLLAKYHILAVAIEKNGDLLFHELPGERLSDDDVLHILTSEDSEIEKLIQDFSLIELEESKYKNVHKLIGESFRIIELPTKSALDGVTLKESKMQALTGLNVAAVLRGEDFIVINDSSFKMKNTDKLLVLGGERKLDYLSKLSDLELLSSSDATKTLESDEVGLVEVILAPRSQLISKTVSELSFREKYDMNVIALWRDGRAVLNNLRNLPFKFGDALLLHGLKSKMPVFAKDSDFVMLAEQEQGVKKGKALFAVLSIFMLIFVAATGIFSLELGAWLAVIILVLSGSISMEDGYREVDWRVIILVAALLPLGIVFDKMHLADQVSVYFSSSMSDASPLTVFFFIGLFSSFISQLLEGSLAIIFFIPVALSVAERYGLDPKLCTLFVTISASNAFLTPFSHRAHLLVMGAGAYRWSDYLKTGLPLTIIIQTALFLMFALSL